MATASLVKDPATGAFTLAPGMGSNPLGGDPGASMTDPYSRFNANLASILAQIQIASSKGGAALGRAKDALQTEAVGAYGGYNAGASPESNTAGMSATLGAFAPAVADVSTQLENANAATGQLGTTIAGMETAYKPTPVGPGESLVTPGGSTTHQGHSYTPAINPNTGLMDGFDQNTGTWASEDNTGGGGGIGGGGSGDEIEAIFGHSNPIGAYATDPNYVSEVSGLYKTISSIGAAANADTLQTYIKNNAGSAPVTGQMVLNAASTYGVDPALLTTILLHESDFGTAGEAKVTNNPGNIGNTGSSSRKYASWQQGVNAAAKNIADRIAAIGGTGTPGKVAGAATTSTSPVGGSFSPDAQTKLAQLPKAYQSYVDAGPMGVAYINDDRVPDNVKPGLQTMASRAGIPYVQPADVGALKSIETVLGNLDSMQTLAERQLSSGVLGHIFGLTIGRAEQGLQTPGGIQLGLFDNYRDTAIKAVQALAGGAGSGLRINMGEIAANTQNLPQATDSKENAIAQIKQLRQLIYTQLAATFPYAQVKVTNKQGQQGTIPAGQLSTAIQKGYSVL